MAQTTHDSPDQLIVFYANERTDIYSPIRNSRRVKYTCFHVCAPYIGFGSSSGGVYLFRKCQNNSYDYLFTILNSDNCGPITCVAFAANDHRLIAMATSRGHLMVAQIAPEYEHNCSWSIVYQCRTFTKHSINIVKWDQYYDYRLYISDESGQTFVLHNVNDMKNLMVVPMPSLVLKLMAKTYQMEICFDLLLLSTQHRYVLYDIRTGDLTQIGKKSVRCDGQYGVCFYPTITSNDNHISNRNTIYCSRPKSRLWECDLKGNVRFTHQFKELLINQVPQLIVNGEDICLVSQCTDNGSDGTALSSAPSQSPTFAKLCVMNMEDKSFIITWATGADTRLYVINPINACIVSYCILDVHSIHDMYCIENDIHFIYNLRDDKRLRFGSISVLTLEQCLAVFVQSNDFTKGANFLINHWTYFSENSSKTQSKSDKLLETVWSNLESDQRQHFQPLEQLIIRRKCDQNSVVIKSEEYFQNSIDSMACDHYNRGSEEHRYYTQGLDLQYNDSIIDVVDIGFTELKKLKDILLSKLNSSNRFDMSLVVPVLSSHLVVPVLSSQTYLKQCKNNRSLDENNECNLILDKTDDNCRQSDTKCVLQSLENELKLNAIHDNHHCVCGSPLPGSHRRQNAIQKRITEFLNENSLQLNYSAIDLLDVSQRNAIWPLYMALMLRCERFEEYLKYSLMLNDVKLLEIQTIQTYLLQNFQQLLDLFSRQRDVGNDAIVRCIECHKSLNNIHNSIKWETIARLCIMTVGVEEGINLLKKFIDRKPLLSIHFYLLVLRMRLVSAIQSPATRHILNQLITHLNTVSKVKSEFSPSVSSSSKSTNTQHIQKQCKGFKINISEEKCAKCKTGLVKDIHLKLIAFDCKHIYHKMCLNSDQNQCLCCEPNH